jgi:hypothetical protein
MGAIQALLTGDHFFDIIDALDKCPMWMEKELSYITS